MLSHDFELINAWEFESALSHAMDVRGEHIRDLTTFCDLLQTEKVSLSTSLMMFGTNLALQPASGSGHTCTAVVFRTLLLRLTP